MNSDLVGVMLTKLTEFATELGHIRSEVANQHARVSELANRYQTLEVLCREVENGLSRLAGELRGRGAIEDRARLSLTQVSDQGTLVMQNDGQVSVKQREGI